MNTLHHIWNTLQAHLKHDPQGLNHAPNMLLFVLIAVAAAAVVLPRLWRVAGLANTVVHETGHALAAVSTFGRLHGIRINTDHSGDTQFLSSRFIPFRIWASWWGYSFPGVAGWGLVAASAHGWSGLALTISAIVAVIVTLQIRNFVALLSIGLISALVLAAWWFLPVTLTTLVVFGVGWFFTLGGCRAAIELFQIHLKGQGQDSDAMALRGMTLIPAYAWCVSFIAANFFCLWQITSITIHAVQA